MMVEEPEEVTVYRDVHGNYCNTYEAAKQANLLNVLENKIPSYGIEDASALLRFLHDNEDLIKELMGWEVPSRD